MTRKFLIAAGVLAATSAPLIAQVPVPPAPPAPGAPMQRMNDRVVTRAELDTRIRAHFARIDVNRDGFITTEEATAMRGAHRVMRHGPAGHAMPMGDPGAAFDRMDSNRDGVLSRDEFAKGRQVRVERRVIVNNGAPGQPRPMRMMRGGMLGGPMMLRMADTNKDGRVSLAEATGSALQHFDRMDSNRDGRLTPEERRAGRAIMVRMRQAG